MFAPETYAARRRALASTIGDGLIVIPGNDVVGMNYAANPYPFRQDGSFLYYAGMDEPGLALVIDAETGESTLYGHDPTVEDAVWEGFVPPLAERAARASVTKTAEPGQLDTDVAAARAAGRAVHVLPPYRGDAQVRLARMLGVAPDVVAEIERALDVTAAMHRAGMQGAQPGRTEFEVAAAVEAAAAAAGAYPSFPPIVTRRGEVFHNHPSAAKLEAGDLLLVDAGAVSPERRYAGDITRVSPVGGRFSDRQRAVYETVLRAQMAVIGAAAPGVAWRAMHDLAARTITDGLKEIGLMKGDTEEAVAAGAHALFFAHGLGHAMGIDVHDLEALGEDRIGYDDEFRRSDQFGTRFLRFGRRLQEGYVMTVEPGVYFIGPLMDQWQAEGRFTDFIDYDEARTWVGFGGVRIEDDIVVTAEGNRVLGPGIPKQPDEVEAVVSGA